MAIYLSKLDCIGVVVLSFLVGIPAGAQAAACAVDSTLATHVSHVQRIVDNDSASIVGLGLPYRPTGGVTAVTDEAVCVQAISAFNALYPSSTDPNRITSAYVMNVGTSFYALVHSDGTPGRTVYMFFTNSFAVITGIVQMG